ncbi:zinc ABC transporter substrate-binding protein [Roseibium denhamense]|uniref:High-affinity zinc uptake system protein ZnuA n=1 Tax=Roseibium denhamense TaxID=76305 RepID=A0ABY1PHL0_9HYPH|nr:zinc ABC transporter substrate-binding protein [Roseibium denhamense]MTI06140.1 zinc ABC transporter substrate-binding protein [Roseibium denhamense]SMP32187.1 zinc transport system substrate-binding protein [Roseibium denhamense]
MPQKLSPIAPAIKTRLLGAASTVLITMAPFAATAAEAPNVVTTIKPLHSIAAAVMQGVGEPAVLIDGAASPHGFALKPSQAADLQNADAVFWIGPSIESSLGKAIDSTASDAAVLEMMDVDGIEHLAIREGASFDAHDHGDHDDHGHDEHAGHGHDDHKDEHTAHGHDDHGHDDHGHDDHAGHDHDHDHDHEEHASAEKAGHDHGHDHENEHAHDDHEHEHEEASHDDHGHGHDHAHEGGKDGHIWLNPDNGIAIAGAMAETLARLDPDHADIYRKNAAAFAERIEALETNIKTELSGVADAKFIVFHDAYHHFEHHFGIEASGAISLTPEALTSAGRMAEIQGRIRDENITCVFQEPQFDNKLVDVALEGSSAKAGTLDPLGATLENGPDLYPQLLSNIATALKECLASS